MYSSQKGIEHKITVKRFLVSANIFTQYCVTISVPSVQVQVFVFSVSLNHVRY